MIDKITNWYLGPITHKNYNPLIFLIIFLLQSKLHLHEAGIETVRKGEFFPMVKYYQILSAFLLL